MNIKHKLDFLCYSWWLVCKEISYVANASFEEKIAENFRLWKEACFTYTEISEFQIDSSVKSALLHGKQSSSCLKYVFDSSTHQPDVVIELGGGIGHNLVRVLNGSFINAPHKTLYVNAECNKNGLSISQDIFESMNYPRSKNILFNYYDPMSSIPELLPLLAGKIVSLFTLTSIEQISYLPHEFNKFLIELSDITSSLEITFCEPVSFQYPQFIPSGLKEQNLHLANNFQHNLNLCELVHELIDQSGISLQSYYPSIFRIKNGLDISGLKLISR